MATFCLLHGKWHDGSCWEPLGALLRERGHAVVAPDLSFEDPDTTYEQRVGPALRAVEGTAEPLVVVAHSLAAAYGPLVPAGQIIYLCPAPTGPLSAQSPMRKARPDFPWPPDDERGVSAWEPDAAVEAMYSRLSPDTARRAAARLRPSGPPTSSYPLAHHPDIPRALVYATEDEFFEPEWERWAAQEVLGVEPIELPGGHFPMLERPDELAELLTSLELGDGQAA